MGWGPPLRANEARTSTIKLLMTTKQLTIAKARSILSHSWPLQNPQYPYSLGNQPKLIKGPFINYLQDWTGLSAIFMQLIDLVRTAIVPIRRATGMHKREKTIVEINLSEKWNDKVNMNWCAELIQLKQTAFWLVCKKSSIPKMR